MKLVRTVLLGAAAGLALTVAATGANADGMPRGSLKDAPRPFSWTGIYVGGHIGEMWHQSKDVPCGGGTCIVPDGDGGVIGGQIGAQYQWSFLVLGVEADGSWANTRGEKPCANPAFTCFLSVDSQASVRGRIGVAAGKALFYATGGWAWADVEGHTRTAVAIFPDDSHRSGRIWGGGVELALTNHIIVGLEYLQADFGTKVHVYDVPYPVEVDTQTLRLRLSYKFGGGGPWGW
jgi:outer membrane immunogenic protein